MINSAEMNWRLRGAQACLGSAQRDFPAGDYRATAQNAQLCIELSAKAVIAHFAEPIWDHDPSDQLLGILREHGDDMARRSGEDVRHELTRLAEDANMAAPWHARSTYGQRAEDRSWIPALDLCTREVAEDLLERATRSFATARKFFVEVCGGNAALSS